MSLVIEIRRVIFLPTYSFLFQIDLRDIEEAYEDSFKHKLTKSIKRKTSGDYQDLLIGILRCEIDQK